MLRVFARVRNQQEFEPLRKFFRREQELVNKDLRRLTGERLYAAQGAANLLDKIEDLIETAPRRLSKGSNSTVVPLHSQPSNKP